MLSDATICCLSQILYLYLYMDRNLLLLPHIVVPKLILDRYHMNSWKLYFHIVRKKPFTFFLFLPSLALTVYVISEAFSFLILSVLQFQAVSFLIMRCINHTNTHRDVSPLALPHSHANVSWQRMARRPHYSAGACQVDACKKSEHKTY